MSRLARAFCLLVSSVLVSTAAFGQCHEWAHDFALSGLDGEVYAFAEFDDGSGPALYVAGNFAHADEVRVGGIARWNGQHWSSVGLGFNGQVQALAVYDDGSGPALYAGGFFTFILAPTGGVPCQSIARWNGTQWSTLPGGGVTGNGFGVRAMRTFDAGSGERLYVAGAFLQAGGQLANNLARFGPAGWEAFTSGADGYLDALAVHDDGSGAKLYVAGSFTQCGSVPAHNLARFDGASFAALGSGTDARVWTLQSFDDGSGAALVAGGDFLAAGAAPAARVARWRNGSWSAFGPGLDAGVRSLAVFDEGAGPRLFASGLFANSGANALEHCARWDGAAWTALAPPDSIDVRNNVPTPRLCVHDDGSGSALYLSASARWGVSNWTHGLARWSGSELSAVGAGRNNQLSPGFFSLARYDDGSGPGVIAVGQLELAGGTPVHGIARWNGARWKALGGGLPNGIPTRAAQVDFAAGRRLVVPVAVNGGGFMYTQLSSWDGNGWSVIATTNPNEQVVDVCAFDDGSGVALYVCGLFHSIGGISAEGLARFDGASWSVVGGGLASPDPNDIAHSLQVCDLGNGPVLVVCGSFTSAGGAPAQHIASWDGTSWSNLGGGIAQPAGLAVAVDHGSGPVLYVSSSGGAFGGLARYDGSSWSAVTPYLNNPVRALCAFDGGSGPALFVGGAFSGAGPLTLNGIARWDGAQWSRVGSGTTLGGSVGSVESLLVTDDGSGPALFAAGNFETIGGVASPYVGKWLGCSGPIASFCHGDGGELPCPCWNSGASGHGCANSASPAGAQLGWSGATNPDTLVLGASGEPATALTIFLQGDAQLAHAAFGDGLRCVGGNLKRLFVHAASGGATSAPAGAEPSIHARSAALGDTIAPGTARFYQAYYRDPSASFCSAPAGGTFNITNGVVVHW